MKATHWRPLLGLKLSKVSELPGDWKYDDKDIKGEAGTLACAASPAANPNVIYAGGQNNGVSSGILKTIDGGNQSLSINPAALDALATAPGPVCVMSVAGGALEGKSAWLNMLSDWLRER